MTIAGQIITIGTAKFIVDDIRDGHRVGDIALRYTLRDGFIKLNGATVLREDYPRLVQWVDDNNLWTSDSAALGLFGVGDSLITMRLPDFRNRFLEGIDSNGGVLVGAGVPNITGYFNAMSLGNNDLNGGIGFVGAVKVGSTNYIANKGITTEYSANQKLLQDAEFDASKSNAIYGNSDTVQPAAIRLIAQIKY